MSLFLVQSSWISDMIVTFPEDQSHHLVHVLRKSCGDMLRCRQMDGPVLRTRIEVADARSCTARILEVIEASEDIHPVTMVIPLLKSQRSEWIVQKVTELGCDRIIPYFFERSVVRPNREKHSTRLSRIAYEACKQSERSTPPEILEEVTSFAGLGELLASEGPALRLLPWESARPSLMSVLAVHRTTAVSRVILAIGPEGGLSPDEVRNFSEAGFLPLSLGQNILRSETAAITALANVVFACRDDWQSIEPVNCSHP
ncbi:MAG TPA: RsmE family RNA methyltransferase [Spirochaetota bacterium]|nr:RsmE family RNA methyltransferase [Spirochaetota bacterium]HPN82862.1 RsmE family RNA methyltransferase [Spirochaetota bacterium]